MKALVVMMMRRLSTAMPVKGLQGSQRLALGAVVMSQVAWLSPHEHDLPVGKGIKPFLRAA